MYAVFDALSTAGFGFGGFAQPVEARVWAADVAFPLGTSTRRPPRAVYVSRNKLQPRFRCPLGDILAC